MTTLAQQAANTSRERAERKRYFSLVFLLFLPAGISLGFAPAGLSDEIVVTPNATTNDISKSSSAPMTLPNSGPFRLGSQFYDVLAPLQDTALKGQAEKQETGFNPMKSGTSAANETSANILRGFLNTDQTDSTITTLQRKPIALLPNKFSIMEAKFDPNINGQIAAQLAHSRTYLDFLRGQMRTELNKTRTSTALPDFSPELNKSKTLKFNSSRISEEIENERKKSRLLLAQEKDSPVQVSPTNFSSALVQDFRFPSVAAFQLEDRPPRGRHAQAQTLQNLNIERGAALQTTDVERELMRRQIDADLKSYQPNRNIAFANQMEGEYQRARRFQQQESKRVRGELDAIMTAIRPNPNSNQEVADATGTAAGRTISWDQWYANFTQQYEPLLIKAFRRYKDPAGENTVSVTVWADRRLQVSIPKKNSSKYNAFDRATIEAYAALNGSATLQFPTHSRRKQISFLIDNKHSSATPINGVESLPFSGDNELLRNTVK